MSTLLENPLPVIVVGSLLALVALLVFLSRRNLASLIALVAIAGVTLLLVLVERLVTTNGEQVETAVLGLADAIAANDAAGVVSFVDPSSTKIRGDIQALMPLVKWSLANASGIQVEVDATGNPPAAVARFRAYLNGVHQQSGQPVPYINQQVEITWVKRGDRWVMDGYTAYYDDKVIDAVSSAAANRPVP